MARRRPARGSCEIHRGGTGRGGTFTVRHSADQEYLRPVSSPSSPPPRPARPAPPRQGSPSHTLERRAESSRPKLPDFHLESGSVGGRACGDGWRAGCRGCCPCRLAAAAASFRQPGGAAAAGVSVDHCDDAGGGRGGSGDGRGDAISAPSALTAARRARPRQARAGVDPKAERCRPYFAPFPPSRRAALDPAGPPLWNFPLQAPAAPSRPVLQGVVRDWQRERGRAAGPWAGPGRSAAACASLPSRRGPPARSARCPPAARNWVTHASLYLPPSLPPFPRRSLPLAR